MPSSQMAAASKTICKTSCRSHIQKMQTRSNLFGIKNKHHSPAQSMRGIFIPHIIYVRDDFLKTMNLYPTKFQVNETMVPASAPMFAKKWGATVAGRPKKFTIKEAVPTFIAHPMPATARNLDPSAVRRLPY